MMPESPELTAATQALREALDGRAPSVLMTLGSGLGGLAEEVAEVAEGGNGLAKTEMIFTVNDRFQYRLPVLGRHNVMNALAAIGVARRLGMDHDEIAERLATFTLPPMRLEVERIGGDHFFGSGHEAVADGLVGFVADGNDGG